MRITALTILLLLSVAASGQSRKPARTLNENRHFDVGLAYMGPLTDDPTPIGFNATFGYEVFYPEFEYISIKPLVGYYYQRYTSRKFKWEEIYGRLNRVVDRVNYKIDHNGFNMGVSANFFMPVDAVNIESVFIFNEFNWIKSHLRARFPDQPQPTDSYTTDFYFHYALKLGIRAFSNNERFRYSIWVGYSSLKLRKHVRKIVPDSYEVPSIGTDITFGFNISF